MNACKPDLHTAKRLVVAVAGGTFTLIGVALLVLPGPGVLVIAAGLSILATEFVWAGRMLRKARDAVTRSSKGAMEPSGTKALAGIEGGRERETPCPRRSGQGVSDGRDRG